VISFATRTFGDGWLKRLLPPIVVGPVIMVIGMSLAGVAINMATGLAGDTAIFPKGASLVMTSVTLLAVIADAKWFAVPDFVAPEFKWAVILFLLPVAIAPAIERFGDIMAISSVTGHATWQSHL
jgi:uracil permease